MRGGIAATCALTEAIKDFNAKYASQGVKVKKLEHWTSPEVIKHDAAEYALPPTMPQTYDDPAVKKTLPYAAQLRAAVQAATSRPVSPVYSQISEAVYTNVNKAPAGQTSPQDAPASGQKQIEKALSTF